MKIIVIGSGIAGLTFANACEQSGFQVRVYEKAHALKNIGGGILLWPHGVRYLESLGLGSAVAPYFQDIRECKIINHLGENIFSEDFSEFFQLIGGSILPIERDILQHSLLKNLSPNVLALNKRCISVKESNNKSIAYFSDGSSEEADLIVGADGIHSVVRQSLLGEHAPIHTNLCWWGGIVNADVIPQFKTHQQFVIFGEKKTFILWPTYNNKWLWYIIAKCDTGLKQLKLICQDWNKDVMQVISASQEKYFQLDVYTHLPIHAWSSKRITLVGDAAHAMGPVTAQGTSLAIEDAYVLIKLLQQSKNLTLTLQEYENIRRHTHHRMYDLENQCSHLMVADHLQDLEYIQQLFSHATIPMLYKDLIPLVDEKATSQLENKLQQEEVAA